MTKRIHTNERTAELALDAALNEIRRCLGLGMAQSGRRDLVMAAQDSIGALVQAFAENNGVDD